MEKYDLIIVGAGPAGIFTAVELLRHGSKKKILLVEKGKPVEKRHCPKAELGHCVNCRPTCAITTGFSGAGAFSDGKLSLSYEVGGDLPSLIGEEFAQELIHYTDKIYLEFGADPHVEGIYTGEDIKEIRKNAIHAGLKLVDCPIRHLGTEKAQQLYLAIQNYLADNGVEMLFSTECENIILENEECKGVFIKGPKDEEAHAVYADTVVIGTGRRGADWLEKICAELEKAAAVAETDLQKEAIGKLVEYYKTGDLKTWDDFNIDWVQDTVGTIDFINGFIEDYDDPLGRKATWEGYVNMKDSAASARTEVLSANAQWFEDNSPVDPRFRKPHVKGVSAKVVDGITLAGATYPATPIGINLPNADWIRRDYGSKSVTIANITHAYDYAAQESPKSTLTEFAYDQAEIDAYKQYGSYTDEIHTDLHECLGHGSGQLLPGVSSTALGEYQSTLEEARADLFGLYYMADPKLVELGIMPNAEAYKPAYSNYIRNGLFVQFTRVELGKQNTEAHMQNRKLIAEWCYEKGAARGIIEKKMRDGKTYFVVNDYEALRGLFAELLAEIQRIKSEGDYAAGKNLVETYAVNIDPQLHKEVLERYAALNLKPYGGFVNPDIVPVEKGGKVVDYKIEYVDNYLRQQLDYGKKYRTL